MQGFTPNTPVLNSLAVSQIVRDNLMSLLDAHAGPALPGYAVEGMHWYDNVNGKMTVVKARGTKPFASVMMGGVIGLYVSMRENGADGSLIALDVRLQDSTLLSGDRDWTNIPAQKLYFNSNRPPSYFAARAWADPLINDPVFICADGILLGKTWEAFAPGTHETIYGTGVFANEADFASETLRAVETEADWQTWEGDVSFVTGVDHFVVAPGDFPWHNVQEWGGKITLLREGAEMDPTTYRVRPFFSGGVVNFAVYSIDPISSELTPFSTATRYTLRIRKPT